MFGTDGAINHGEEWKHVSSNNIDNAILQTYMLEGDTAILISPIMNSGEGLQKDLTKYSESW